MCIQFSSAIPSRLVLLKLHPPHEIQNVVLFHGDSYSVKTYFLGG